MAFDQITSVLIVILPLVANHEIAGQVNAKAHRIVKALDLKGPEQVVGERVSISYGYLPSDFP
jgi:hypothetical protein